ncbi:MAG: hypothetical protein H7Z20_09390 [Bdellovibrio sp.]|nr:hypothetical protein [Methylotenera sp.]
MLDMPNDMKEFIGVNPIMIDYIELNKSLDECVAALVDEYRLVFKK